MAINGLDGTAHRGFSGTVRVDATAFPVIDDLLRHCFADAVEFPDVSESGGVESSGDGGSEVEEVGAEFEDGGLEIAEEVGFGGGAEGEVVVPGEEDIVVAHVECGSGEVEDSEV